MFGVILSENEIHEFTVFVDYRQRVKFMLPYNIVRVFQRGTRRSGDKFGKGRHKIFYFIGQRHSADSVISARNYTEQFTVTKSVIGNRYRRKSVSLFKIENVRESSVGRKIRRAYDKTRLIRFDFSDHLRLVFYRLRTIDKTHTALFCERDGESIV
ncbi:uncharacterized protein BN767_01075 [Acidiphilium sp. CAG:727]|nr:uncharacterized protein BN767_01075 [Acidiphilium sp. CAG:727]